MSEGLTASSGSDRVDWSMSEDTRLDLEREAAERQIALPTRSEQHGQLDLLREERTLRKLSRLAIQQEVSPQLL